jgi:hypothetical protein
MLIVVEFGGLQFILGQGANVVGRHQECDIRLFVPSVSRRHLMLRVDRTGVVTAEDLGATNGTWVNNQWLEGTLRLENGDVLQLGGQRGEVMFVTNGALLKQPRLPGDRSVDPRRSRRVPVQIMACYKSTTSSGVGVVCDLCEQGLFLSGFLDIPDTSCRLTMMPPGLPSLTVEGVVRHRYHGGVGIQLSCVEEGARSWLRSMVEGKHITAPDLWVT